MSSKFTIFHIIFTDRNNKFDSADPSNIYNKYHINK